MTMSWTWKITWRGKSWTDDDLTGQHLGVLAILRGADDWADLDVETAIAQAKAEVIDGYMRLVNMLCAFVIVDRAPEGTAEDEAHELTTLAIAEVRSAKADDILGSFSVNR